MAPLRSRLNSIARRRHRSGEWRALGVVLALASATPAVGAHAGPTDAGASTFESGTRRYAPREIRLEEISVPKVARELPPAPKVEADGPSFAIDRFEIAGSTLVTPTQLERAVERFRGEGKTLGDIEAARDAVQKLYEAEGFLTVAVTIPQQTVESGVVRLEVLEARVGTVAVQNDGIDWVSERRVRRSLENTRPGGILRQTDLQEDLSRANASRDARVRPQLAAGAKPGEVDVALIVDDRIPLHGSIAYHNEHTEGSPETRMEATVSYSNVWGLGHEAGVFYQFVPTAEFNDVQIWAGSYRMPMPWDDGQNFFAYYASSDTENAAASGGGLSILGQGTTAGGRYSISLPRVFDWKRYSHEINFGADYKDIENAVAAPGVEIVTPITYLPFTVAYGGTYGGDHAITSGRLGLDFHFAGIVDGSSENDFQDNRGGQDPDSDVTGDYRIVKLSLQQSVRMPSLLATLAAGRFVDLPTPNRAFFEDWTLDLRARGQIADQPLIATEQFGAGGVDTVRGYLDRERFGDNAYALQFELRTPSYRGFLRGRMKERVQATLFWDSAELWLQEDPNDPRTSSRLQSYGVGIRAGFFEALSTELYVAQPLIDTQESTGPRLHFRLALGF